MALHFDRTEFDARRDRLIIETLQRRGAELELPGRIRVGPGLRAEDRQPLARRDLARQRHRMVDLLSHRPHAGHILGAVVVGVHVPTAVRHGDKPAIHWKDNGVFQDLTWSQYRSVVHQAAAGLASLGVNSGDVTKIIGISVTSNWLGYCLLAGGLFASGSVEPPGSWAVGKISLQLIGVALLVVVGIYLYFCFFSKKREYQIKNKSFTLPPAKIVLLQFLVACFHWTLMAATIYQFMPDELSFPTVYAVLLVSCVAGAVSHVPGGLGVLEAVFVALLAGDVPKYQLIAGIFAYRCVFYLAPLLISLPLYLAFESFYKVRSNSSN